MVDYERTVFLSYNYKAHGLWMEIHASQKMKMPCKTRLKQLETPLSVLLVCACLCLRVSVCPWVCLSIAGDPIAEISWVMHQNTSPFGDKPVPLVYAFVFEFSVQI